MNKARQAALLGIVLMSAQHATAAELADTIFTNAKVYTDKPAEAVAIANGKILYVGSNQIAGISKTSQEPQGGYCCRYEQTALPQNQLPDRLSTG